MSLDKRVLETIKKKISEQMTEELVGKISYKNNKVRVKVTYEVECEYMKE